MATQSKAQAHWEGSLFEGSGRVELVTSGVASFDVSWAARAESGAGTTNPEELIAAAHATCFSMALSNMLAKNGTPPASLDTRADVTFVPGTGITCPAAGTVVTCTGSGSACTSPTYPMSDLTGAGITLGTLPANGSVTMSFTCTVN